MPGAEVITTRSHPHKVGLDPKDIDRLAKQYGSFAAHILKSQRPSTFSVEDHYIEDFGECLSRTSNDLPSSMDPLAQRIHTHILKRRTFSKVLYMVTLYSKVVPLYSAFVKQSSQCPSSALTRALRLVRMCVNL